MIIFFDIGATWTRYTFSEDGRAFGRVYRAPTDPSAEGFDQFVASMRKSVGVGSVSSIVGGLPVELDEARRVVVLAKNLPQWVGLDVVGKLESAFGCSEIHLENDIVMCGLGEAHYGAGLSDDVMAYFTLSTGVNAVRIVDGRVDSSIPRFEIGFEIVDIDTTYNPITLEQMIGGAELEKKYDMVPHALKGLSVWRREEVYLAQALYNLTLLWSPKLIVLGGGVAKDVDLRRVMKVFNSFPRVFSQRPSIKRAHLRDKAGLYGAMSWYIQHI